MIEINASGVEELRARIAVVGVGGAGGNAVETMIRQGVRGVDFAVANTDAQALNASSAPTRLQLGRNTTQGLGAGSRPEIGWAAAEESAADIAALLEGAHMCFVAAGMGGGTGTGAAPVIAKAARERGILTVGVVTKPFGFEGKRRIRAAEAGIEELERHVDTLIVIPNQNLFRIASPGTTFKAAFDLADDVLQQGVRGITDLMVMPGLVNLDFADIRSIMANRGRAMMGTGEASGDNRALEAAERAISNPLLDDALKGARGLVVSITGGEDMRLMELDEAASHIKDLVDPEADIIWGSAFDPALDGRLRVSVIATGIEGAAEATREEASAPAIAAPAIARPFFFARDRTPAPVEPAPAALPQEAEPAPAAAEAVPVVLAEAAPPPPALPAEAPAPQHEEPLLLSTDNIVYMAVPAAEPAPPVSQPEPETRGPSLFERMAAVARGSARAQIDADLAPLFQVHQGRFAALGRG